MLIGGASILSAAQSSAPAYAPMVTFDGTASRIRRTATFDPFGASEECTISFAFLYASSKTGNQRILTLQSGGDWFQLNLSRSGSTCTVGWFSRGSGGDYKVNCSLTNSVALDTVHSLVFSSSGGSSPNHKASLNGVEVSVNNNNIYANVARVTFSAADFGYDVDNSLFGAFQLGGFMMKSKKVDLTDAAVRAKFYNGGHLDQPDGGASIFGSAADVYCFGNATAWNGSGGSTAAIVGPTAGNWTVLGTVT